MTREEIQRERIKELVWRKVIQVTSYEDRNNAIERGFDPDECSEFHLAGDCPLCGAL